MVPAGVELMIGVVQDPLFGPLMAFGLGGIHVEILADVQFRVTPPLNPLFGLPPGEGCLVADARIRIVPAKGTQR